MNRSVLGVLACLTVACSALPTSSSSPLADPSPEDRVAELWAEGQHALAQLSQQWRAEGSPPVPGDVFQVKSSRFRFVAHREPLSLAGEPVGGYFEPASNTIHYYEPMFDGAIPHEAGHAILHSLGDARWRCVFHQNCN